MERAWRRHGEGMERAREGMERAWRGHREGTERAWRGHGGYQKTVNIEIIIT
jgi:hypothetical protein